MECEIFGQIHTTCWICIYYLKFALLLELKYRLWFRLEWLKQESTLYAKWCHSSVSEINHILPFYFGMLHHSQFWQLHWTNDRCSFCTWTVFKFWPSKAIHYKIRHSLAAFQVPFSRHMESFWHIFTFRPTFWFWSLSYRSVSVNKNVSVYWHKRKTVKSKQNTGRILSFVK